MAARTLPTACLLTESIRWLPATMRLRCCLIRTEIEEVRTIVNDYTAEYGRASGVVDIITKSGTNAFHGSVFWSLAKRCA